MRRSMGMAVVVVTTMLMGLTMAGSATAGNSYGAYPDPREVQRDHPSTWIDAGYYRLAYNGEIWQVKPDIARATALTFTDWDSAGRPSFRPARTDYVKYPWDPAVYAVTYFGPDREQWYWDQLTLAQWTAAGRPTPRHAGWIDGTEFYTYATGNEVFASVGSRPIHKLTYAEWEAAQFPAVGSRPNDSYYRLSWDSAGTILYYDQAHGGNSRARHLSYGSWQWAGFPTPMAVNRVPDDLGFFVDAQGVVSYYARGWGKALTYAEWQAAGFPEPTRSE